jgi:hypothetical protein
MGIHNIGCTAGSKQPSHVGGVNSVERYYVGGRLPKEPGQTNLAFRLADSLSQGTRGNSDTGSCFPGTGQQDKDSTFVAVDGDQFIYAVAAAG